MRKTKWLKNLLIITLVTIIIVGVNTSLENKVQATSITGALPINQIFPDPNLAEEVKKVLGKKSVTNVISQMELERIDIFNANERNIQSIEGLQYCTKLNNLDLSGNQISDISPLKNLTELRVLDLRINEIRDLNALKGLKQLTMVDLAYQKWTEKIAYQPKIVIVNAIKGPDGEMVRPHFISDNGIYINGDIIWNLPTYRQEVSYKFGQLISVGKTMTTFNGMVVHQLYSEMPLIKRAMPINKIFPDYNLAKVIKNTLRKKELTDVISQSELNKVEQIKAENKTIYSIEGMQYLSNLRTLHLSDNQIRDIYPLENLAHLSEVSLNNNDLTDESIAELLKMKQLECLSIWSYKMNSANARNTINHLIKRKDFKWSEK
ncbi:internalin N-terminal domain-containing protein [Listeria ivanovii]|uniref:Internalin N-terminal domain-containing protein n=2 Tax=Listeria ivanovii TaxID=1638 RepID=A0ABS1G0T9_LISIV|nr:internalin N-terminal domain-containing protein [Listeria ivanovii]MBK1960486.1 internalin N-terminal domain-containing protein [Listeria ivanovii subsp. londoniensis]MBK1965072.1 internalin N-terminal domain-containing protein [Listeria ivanovii subsp. londoniensis]MBK1984588.1 internalin N-terminal domain-containing protein [Listeria ivanovii subsp. londoniensis]MBK1995646.1 internalin N-terminal domain-containing protein [Listeria ivanovii subsp. londoniensis]MBK2003009.1 internalin N-te